jgi:glutathione synthase/RimK-type ligase-like ATP-grasp enzyme
MTKFDIAVLYRSSTAMSAQNENYDGKKPFPEEKRHQIYNRSYEYLLSKLKSLGLNVIFTSSADIVGAGRFSSFWTFDGQSWKRNLKSARSKVIFDKFTPFSTKDKLSYQSLTSCACVQTFNSPFLVKMFGDKLLTYTELAQYCIPTVQVKEMSEMGLFAAAKKLKILLSDGLIQIKNEKYVLKDRSGAGGYGIHKINLSDNSFEDIQKHCLKDEKKKKNIDYVLQPFMDFRGGFDFGNKNDMIDLRLIFSGEGVKQAYVRIAKKNDFRCNEHQGGDLIYKKIQEVPNDVEILSKKIILFLSKKIPLKNRLFALDFVSTKNKKIYLMEGNSNPGIDWNQEKSENVGKTKELIDTIAENLSSLFETNKKSVCELCLG